jgi:hypothetical protein
MGQHFDAERGEQGREFLELAGVAAGEDEFVFMAGSEALRRCRGLILFGDEFG